MTGRPRIADFESGIGSTFSVSLSGSEIGTWTLQALKVLAAPDEEELRDLDFFSLTFLHHANPSPEQGIYLVSDQSGFRQTLFATPFRQDQMVVTVA
ncbi:hypothetical protein N9908_01950 [Akkermansiaceae bacterium]|nr:hypothetical protein [Akkermansiaceae bacterium]